MLCRKFFRFHIIAISVIRLAIGLLAHDHKIYADFANINDDFTKMSGEKSSTFGPELEFMQSLFGEYKNWADNQQTTIECFRPIQMSCMFLIYTKLIRNIILP